MANTLTNPRLMVKYQMQWWSNLETHILQTEQCLDRAGFTTSQVLQMLLDLYIIPS